MSINVDEGGDPIDFFKEYVGVGGISESARFIPRSVTRVPYIPPGGSGFPKGSGDIVFEDDAGRAMCWRMGQQTAAEFVKGRNGFPLKGANDILFHTGQVRVFFPIMDSTQKNGGYFAKKSLTIKANPTLARVLSTIEVCAYHAVADHLIKNKFASKVTVGDIQKELNHVVCCHLVCSRAGGWNSIYCRI
jgi:hypothetical protein